jgi:sodium/potassium-transporting ATPase subunit alpha
MQHFKVANVLRSYPKFDKDDENFKKLQRVATVCNKTTFVFSPGETPDISQIQSWKTMGDASESALVKFCHPLRDIIEYRSTLKQVAAIPFNSVNKWQLSIHEDREKNCNVVLMKGAPEKIAELCQFVWMDGTKVLLNHKEIERRNLELGDRGERVLAFAELELPTDQYPLGFAFDVESQPLNFPVSNFTLCGLVSLIDPPRPGVPEAVLTCQEAGIKVIMVTGDHPVTARAIARSVNIMPGKTVEELAIERGIRADDILSDVSQKQAVDSVVTVGHNLALLSDEDWQYILSRKYIVFARTLPQQKQDIVTRLQSSLGGSHIVAVTGDGVNDSPALKQANTGIAMGVAGSDVAKEAADIILMDDNFASIVKGIAEGRLLFDNLQKCCVYVLTSNIPEIVPFLVFIAGKSQVSFIFPQHAFSLEFVVHSNFLISGQRNCPWPLKLQ